MTIAHIDPVTLINQAFIKIGEEPLQTLDDEVIGGMAASIVWEMTRDVALGVYPWTFCQSLRPLQRLADAPGNGWLYAFQRPGDAIGPVRRVYSKLDTEDFFRAWQVDADRIFANETALWADILYTPEIDAWPLLFRQGVVTLLASELADPIAGDANRRATLRREALGPDFDRSGELAGILGRAAQIDAQGRPSQRLPLEHAAPVAWRFRLG